ncbi:right-handed parallel beta-helix repeat-containing protein [Planctomycetota bacterium]
MKCFKNSQILVVVALSLLLCSFAKVAYTAEVALYVSPKGNDSWTGDSIDRPFATIQKARDAIRKMKQKGELKKPVTVYIRGGLYELDETLVFTLEDSGTESCPITYTAHKDEEPVISGGKEIAGPWRNYKGRIQVCDIPAVKAGKWSFRQLFLNGERQTRARTPNDGYFRIADAGGRGDFKYKPGDIEKWNNLGDVEILMYHKWNESRLIIQEINEEQQTVTLTGPIGPRLGGNRYYVENALELLGQPGEWYLDRHEGKLYFWPVDEDDPSGLRAPVLNELVRFEGDVEAKNYVRHITICGLTFCDADYILPDEGIPSIRDPGDIWFPSAITLKGVSECTFENNTVRNVGTYGLDLTGDAIHVIGNKIYDTGSGGIITRSYGRHRNVISYNHVHHCGSVFPAAVGINIDDGGGLIANNLVHDTSHSGIYGRHFATDYGQEFQRRNQEQGLIIEFNEIYDVMHEINDGAGIFIRDDYVVIRNNLIHDVWSHPEGQGSPGWGIYLGCDTRNCLVENNVVYRAEAGQLVWQNNKNNTIFNNIFVDGTNIQYNYSNPGEHGHERIRLLRNIICFSSPSAVLYDADGERSVPMESDYNLIFHTEGKELRIRGVPGVTTFEEWQERGLDTHSIIADPLFVDPENDDYSLRPDSPAFELGFKPIDLSRVGLRCR